MSKSYVLFSLALGGLVLAGCNKDEKPEPVPVPPATAPSTAPTTEPAVNVPATVPTTLPATGAAADGVKPSLASSEIKAATPGTVAKDAPTTNPITDANK